MSDETSPQNVTSVWILVVLLGGLSVPFWRWDDTPQRNEATVQWVEAGDEQAKSTAKASQNSLVSATTSPVPDQPSELLHEFVGSDVSLQIQDAVKENQGRPGIPKQFQGEGIPLSDIKPWIPKPMGYDATPSEHQKLAETQQSPSLSEAQNLASVGKSDHLTRNASPATWPDQGYPAGSIPIASPTMYYRADPTTNIVSGNTSSTTDSHRAGEQQNRYQSGATSSQSPGQMVSAGRITATDPPALLDSSSAARSEPTTTGERPGNHVQVTPSPAITPPSNPLRSGAKPSPTPLRRQGTVIQQPKSQSTP